MTMNQRLRLNAYQEDETNNYRGTNRNKGGTEFGLKIVSLRFHQSLKVLKDLQNDPNASNKWYRAP